MSEMDVDALMEELKKLKEENEYLKTIEALPVGLGTDMWGRPRAPLTEEERARFKAANQRNRQVTPSPETNKKLQLATKIANLHEEIAARKKGKLK